MANNILEYKGYQAIIEFSSEDCALYGKVLDIDDKILFEIEDPNSAFEVFKATIDEYLEFCEEEGKTPDKPYKGVFNVRISPSLHKQAAQSARRAGVTLNDFVKRAISDMVSGEHRQPIINVYLNQNRDYSSSKSNLASYNRAYSKPMGDYSKHLPRS